ncbi:MAG: hypothetical protein ACRC6V_02020 [Bacteroidales bacterium]
MRNKASLPRNPVKRHMHKAVRASIIASKRRSLLLSAMTRDEEENDSIGQFSKETIGFASGSSICWDSPDDALQGCLDCVGCSSIFD